MGFGPGIGQVTATQEQLDAMAQKCQETRESIAQGMASLIQRIEAITMRGAAANALQEKSAQLNQGLRTVMDALDELSGKISNASKQYGVQDQEAARDLAAIGADAGGTVANVLRGY
jgi:Proteins of 100 residues with WXG.